MSFLIDTDICSAYLKNDRVVTVKMMMHYGGLSVSAVTTGELLAWALRKKAPPSRLSVVQAFLNGVNIIPVDLPVAEKFGEIRAISLDQGQNPGPMDLLNAAIALVHNMTMVTHNVADYAIVPGLTIDDWLVP
jgi:tRNA(fMet)-specific endonuclease VapC